MFPPLPSWSGFHPLVIHFPIGLLIVAPVLVLMGLAFPKHRQVYSSSALVLMIIGTLTIFIAMASGEAAEQAADLPDGIDQVINQHEHLAGLARNIFTVLTIGYASFLVAIKYQKTPLKHLFYTLVSVFFLFAYTFGTIVLANAAHAGGRLVHEFGVKSVLPEMENKVAQNSLSMVPGHEKVAHAN